MPRDPRTRWNDTEPDDESAGGFFRPRSGGASAASSCPPPELVQALQADVLPPQLKERVAEHVGHCAVCRSLREALDDPSVGSLTPEEHDRILKRVHTELARSERAVVVRRVWKVSAVAATVALAAIASVLVWQSRRAPLAPPPQVSSDIYLPAAESSVFQVEKPGIRARAAFDILSRGSSKPEEPEALAHALEPYHVNDYLEAARRLRTLVRRHPNSAAGNFYLGISELFLHRDAEAVKALEAAERLAKDNPNPEREARWYLALAYHRTGQVEQSWSRLEALCQALGGEAAWVCRAARELRPITVFGVVTASDGTPLAGASVGELAMRFTPDLAIAYPGEVAATSDSAGRYRVSNVKGSVLQASKPGYFTAAKLITTAIRDTQVEFVLDPWVHISLGQVVRVTLKPGGPFCGDPNELCQLFALTVPTGGTLEVSLDSIGPRKDYDLYVETPDGERFGRYSKAPLPLRVTIPAERDATYQINVLSYSDRPRDFQLTTRLR